MQTAIPCTMMRGGTSKGAYFLAADLPADPAARDAVLLAVMGSPDARQIDGIGGATSLTSKVAVIAPSADPEIDVDYLFLQVVVDEARVDDGQNCGNILVGVGPFAIEHGLVEAQDGTTPVRIRMVNSDALVEAVVQTPGGFVEYEGDAAIDGVPGSAAPVLLDFLDTAGSACGSLLPTGNACDTVEGIEVTMIDNGMPVVIMRAGDLGRSGYESKAELDADDELKARIESIRLACGPLMGLGDVKTRTFPKMFVVAPPREGGLISTRSFIPHDCHAAVGVFAAVSVATACFTPGAVTDGIAVLPEGARKTCGIEHPTGTFVTTVKLSADGAQVERAGIVRTTRKLFDGKVFVPAAAFGRAA
ncbi:MAG TPA: 4-oxalomesaconate tautomerase [Alphaproteobacteria bacterium]|nr:4-oxalomesaconate tautomerase [Alphaproteobacteria bacterium]